MKSVAVYCGSRMGASEVYVEKAIELGKLIAQKGITLIYGGATVGIMGKIADTVLAEGGKVIGVMPKTLESNEKNHQKLTKLYIVETMHERKQMMMDLSDGFIIFPGGIGTMEEFFEVYTWNTIGIMNKPTAIFNVNGYYDLLIQFMNHIVSEQFLTEQTRQNLIETDSVEQLFVQMEQFLAPIHTIK